MKPSIKPKRVSRYDVSVIIVCRNGKKVTRVCIDGIEKMNVQEIIVVDNNSSDGTAKLLDFYSKKDKRFKIIHNTTNNGFAEANNQGFRSSTGQFILFLNNDTEIRNDFFPPLLKSLKKRNIAAVQPMILFPDKTIDSIGSFLTPTGFLYHKAHRMTPDKSFLQQEAVYTMKGACMLWKRSVLEEIGVFDESYFAYFEETDLCHRAINAGYKVVCNPLSTIIHLGGFTSNTIQPTFIQYHNAKNRIHTFCVDLHLKNLIMILPFHLFLTQFLIVKTFLTGHLSLSFAIERGLLVGLLGGLKERSQTISSRRVAVDRYIKHPDLQYYQALFSSLQGYSKIW